MRPNEPVDRRCDAGNPSLVSTSTTVTSKAADCLRQRVRWEPKDNGKHGQICHALRNRGEVKKKRNRSLPEITNSQGESKGELKAKRERDRRPLRNAPEGEEEEAATPAEEKPDEGRQRKMIVSRKERRQQRNTRTR